MKKSFIMISEQIDTFWVCGGYLHDNFARIHQTLRATPAMEAGVADQVWSVEEIVGLLP